MKKSCKIIQDLLPQYIDKITSVETNEMIESHLQECDECSTTLENMKTEVRKEGVTLTKKEINYIKNYRRKILALKLVVIFIILVIVGIFVYNIGYRYNIVSKTIERNIEYNIGRKLYICCL